MTPQEGEASAYSKAKDNSTVLQPRLFSRRPIVSRVRMVLRPAEHCVAAPVWNSTGLTPGQQPSRSALCIAAQSLASLESYALSPFNAH